MFVFSLSLCAFASNSQNEKEDQEWSFPYTKEIGVLSGYAHGNLSEKGSYKIIPGIIRLGFNLDSIGFKFSNILPPAVRKSNIKIKGFMEFLLESYVNAVVSPDSNVETGAAVFLKYSYPLTQKIYPYVLSGVGVGYISQHTREQSIQLGFTPQVGAGISYFFKKDTALNVEYRYRHFSNAKIKEPNDGINVNMFLVGVSLFY
jgi:opacity protein-like surface antigen